MKGSNDLKIIQTLTTYARDLGMAGFLLVGGLGVCPEHSVG